MRYVSWPLAALWLLSGVLAAQPESANADDCGAAAVRNLARLLAPDAPPPGDPGKVSERSLQDLVGLLAAAGVAAEPVKGTPAELLSLGRPCILHLTGPEHFAVLCAASADHRQVALMDGTAGQMTWLDSTALQPRLDGYAVVPKRRTEPGGATATWDSTLSRMELPALGSTATFAFGIRNTGAKPLTLELAGKDCGCVQAEVVAAVAPGTRGLIKLTYRADSIGSNRHVAIIRTNDPSLPLQHLLADAVVTGGVEIRPRDLNVQSSFHAAWERDLTVTTPARVAVRAIEVTPAVAEAAIVRQTEDHGVRTTALRLQGDRATPSGRMTARVRIEFADAAMAAVELPLTVLVRPAFEIRPATLFLGLVPGIGYATLQIVSLDGSTPRLAGVTSSDGKIELGTPVQLLHAIQIPVVVRPPAGGLLDGVVHVKLIAPEQRELDVVVTAIGAQR